MRTSGTFVSLALGLLLRSVEATPAPQAAANKCSQNNCLRAVIAGSFPNRPTVADCSSFLLRTVTPSVVTETTWVTVTPVTETATSFSTDVQTELTTATVYETVDVTETVTTTTTASPVVNKRQVTVHPTAIPSYASACRSAEAYSSACSCIGVNPSATTVATPTTTVTSTSTATAQVTIGKIESVTTTVAVTVTEVETVTATATTTVVEPYIPRQFKLRVSGGLPHADGKYLQSIVLDSYIAQLYFTDEPSIFSLDATEALYSVSHPNLQLSGDGPRPNVNAYRTYALTSQARADFNYLLLSCSISPVDFEFTCQHFNEQLTYLYECGIEPGVELYIGVDGLGLPGSNCRAIKLYAERA